MPLRFHLRQLETEPLCLDGEIPLPELDLEGLDELMHPVGGLKHELRVERHERGLLVQGCLELPLACECARCLRPFQHVLRLSDWCRLLPLEGEDRIPVRHECVDLTPYVREDIVLALPQRPLCEPECAGLIDWSAAGPEHSSGTPLGGPPASAWAALNKLKT
jgi:uncharacterized protein